MLFAGLLLGLFSSLHCIGMCGPIALMIPVSKNNKWLRALQIALYHFGRITTYCLLGIVFAIVGKSFSLAGIQQQVSIAIGILLIVLAISSDKVLFNLPVSKFLFSFSQIAKANIASYLKDKNLKAQFLLGFFNGFLPCGMVYAALFAALTMKDAIDTFVFMFLYGIGTVPLMTIVVLFSNSIRMTFGKKLQKLIPLFLIIMGTLFILRGSGLNLPYISPSGTALFIKQNPNCH